MFWRINAQFPLRPSFVWLVLLLAYSVSGNAQPLLESFTQGFTDSLGWEGDIELFRAGSGSVQLADARSPTPGRATVYLPAATADSACYSLTFALNFSPSASNRARWWLAADQAPHITEARGYFVLLGGISGNDDAFELRFGTAAQSELIISTSPGSAANDPVAGSLDICRSIQAQWTLDWQPSVGVAEQGTANFDERLVGSIAGLDLTYTSTRTGAFSFSELRIDPVVRDTTAPRLVLAKAETASLVRLTASEPLDESATQIALYRVDGREPAAVSVVGAEVLLELPIPLNAGASAPVTVAEWRDVAGNAALNLQATVRFDPPGKLAPYDVLITEVMADPSPAVGLPEVEFVEVYNASAATISLSSVQLQRGDDAPTPLPDTALAPGAYLALAKDAVANARYVSYADLPTLPNTGALLTLIGADGTVLHQVDYAASWHQAGRTGGGYSLELIDLEQLCLVGQANWQTSAALSGGTPGLANAAAAVLSIDSLRLLSLSLGEANRVTVSTNRALNDLGTNNFSFSGNARVASVQANARLGSYTLTFSEFPRVGEVATIALSQNTRSCVLSEVISTTPLVFGTPASPAIGDWAINEIMFDPLAGEGRYVELLNRSDQLLSTADVRLALAKSDGSVAETFTTASDMLAAPRQAIVFSANVDALASRYQSSVAAQVLDADVPTLGGEACLLLFDINTERRLDFVCYSDHWHNRAYASTDGISLERIDAAANSQDANNWTSAALSVGGGTPTQSNSQSRVGRVLPKGAYALDSERLSPDGDGFEDLLTLRFSFEEPGTLLDLTILDLSGRPVFSGDGRAVAAGSSGTWTWDGITDDGVLAPVGTYVLRASAYGDGRTEEVQHLTFSLLTRR